MSLYKPVIVKKEIDDEHYYFVNGKYVPGVTSILSETMPFPPALRFWIGDVGNEKAQEKLEKAAARGTLLHNACERLLKGETIELCTEFKAKEDKKCLVGFINWVNEYNPKIHDPQEHIEFTVASEYGFAGTLDLFCYINEEPWIIDFKSSSGVYDSHKLQLAAYHQAFLEMTGIDAKLGILHLNHRVKKGYSFHTDLEIGKKKVTFEDFLKVFEVYKMLNGGVIKEPNLTNVYPDFINLYKKEEFI